MQKSIANVLKKYSTDKFVEEDAGTTFAELFETLVKLLTSIHNSKLLKATNETEKM
jgi:hypothetical protein